MSGWIQNEIWLGMPMMALRISTRVLRGANFDIGALWSATDHDYAITTLRLLLIEAGAIPADARIVGVSRPANMDAIEITLVGPSIPTTTDRYGTYRVEDVDPDLDLKAVADRLREKIGVARDMVGRFGS